jgi:hypothetical protein
MKANFAVSITSSCISVTLSANPSAMRDVLCMPITASFYGVHKYSGFKNMNKYYTRE